MFTTSLTRHRYRCTCQLIKTARRLWASNNTEDTEMSHIEKLVGPKCVKQGRCGRGGAAGVGGGVVEGIGGNNGQYTYRCFRCCCFSFFLSFFSFLTIIFFCCLVVFLSQLLVGQMPICPKGFNAPEIRLKQRENICN